MYDEVVSGRSRHWVAFGTDFPGSADNAVL
jgi:hypothetical protein